MTSPGIWYPEGPLYVPMFTSSQTIGIGGATPGELDNNDRFAPDTRIKSPAGSALVKVMSAALSTTFMKLQVHLRAPFKAMSLKKGQV